MPYTDSIIIAGGFESDAIDALPQVGGFINVKKYMDHQHFHAESLLKTTTKGARFPLSAKAVQSSGKGPRGGMFYNRLPSPGVETTTVQQGWLVMFVHTADQGSLSGDEISLGPLLLKWRIRLKEASERQQYEGQEDYHENVGAGGGALNPLGWTSSFALQSTLDSSSTLEVQTRFSGNEYHFKLPIGLYEIRINHGYASLGATGMEIDPITNGAYYDLLNSDTGLINSSITNGTTLLAWARVRIKDPTQATNWVRMTVATSSTTGYTSNYASLRISPLPTGALTFTHSDLRLRGAAWLAQRPKDRVQSLVREELKKLGHVSAEEKKDTTEWQYYLARKNEEQQKQKTAKFALRTWELDEKDDLESEPDYERVEEAGPQLSYSAEKKSRALSSLRREKDFALFKQLCPETAKGMLGLEESSEKHSERRKSRSEEEYDEYMKLSDEGKRVLAGVVQIVDVKRENEEKKAKPLDSDVVQRSPPSSEKNEPAPAELPVLQRLLGSGWSLVRADPPAAAPSTTASRQ
jgi:hypothetical protein